MEMLRCGWVEVAHDIYFNHQSKQTMAEAPSVDSWPVRTSLVGQCNATTTATLRTCHKVAPPPLATFRSASGSTPPVRQVTPTPRSATLSMADRSSGSSNSEV